MKKTLVLNHAFMPISILPVERAFSIYYKGNAEIWAEYDDVFKTVNPPYFPKPSIIRTFSSYQLNYNKVALTRRNIYKRDEWKCVYCKKDGKSNNLTLDHVVPRSKGGKDTWENLVTCCTNCNSEKADLEIEEWGKDHPKPFKPHYLMMVNKSVGYHSIPKEWEPYLFM